MGKVTTYAIRKGRHRINNAVLTYLVNLFTPVILFRKTEFKITCWVLTPEGIDHNAFHRIDHWNKLYGFTTWRIHRNSKRIGWRFNPYTGRFTFSSYTYTDGQRIIIPTDSMFIGRNVLWGEPRYVDYITLSPGIYWRCFPFYGGHPKSNALYRFHIMEERV